MTSEGLDTAIKTGMTVKTVDGATLGRVGKVWAGTGAGESWGAAGSHSQTGATATDPTESWFSESMPGEGDDYFQVDKQDGSALYVPFAAVSGTDGDDVLVAVDEDSIPGMQWDVQPDFVNVKSEPDSQGGSHVA